MVGHLNLRRHVRATSSWAVIGLLMATAPGIAFAQVTEDAPPETGEAEQAEGAEILVVGSRASQQSAINRKRNARTATDSIVADDIGSFPDRNVAEAVSRVAGVALNRNEFGEGDGVAVRGNGGGLTRVELDGLGVPSTHGVSLGADNGRSSDFRELPAELVKTIDVVKGSTADMTEGSLGGSILIETRSGLDFTKPYYSLRAGVERNSLDREFTPDFTGIATHKFFGDRLGLIASGTYRRVQNESHRMETTTSGNRGADALFDFDLSPEKTWEYNLDTLGTDEADLVFANSTETPRTFLTKAISAQSKADCFTLFPHNPTGTNAQKGQRILEQQSCLNQWNDYTPSLIRHFMPSQEEERYSVDVRADFQVTDNLTIYGKVTQANRKVDDQFRSRTPVSTFVNAAGTFVTDNSVYPRLRSVSPTAAPGYYLFDPQFGISNAGNNAHLGNVLNVVPSSVQVDEAHNVTGFTLTNNAVNIDQISNIIDTKTRYFQGGAEWRTDRLEVDAMAGVSRATTTRADMRTSRSYTYGDATLTLQPNGLWDIDLPDDYDETDVTNFVQLNPAPCTAGGTNPLTCTGQAAAAPSPTNPGGTQFYTAAQMPMTTPNFSVSYSPRIGEVEEKLAKFDVAYRTDGILPFITRFKTGAMYRSNTIDSWGGTGNAGVTIKSAVGTFGQPGYVPAVILPTANVRGSLRACQPTATSSAPGGLSCNYGYVPLTDPARVLSGVDTLTPEDLAALFARTTEIRDVSFFGDYPDKGNLPPAWAGIDTDLLFSELGAFEFMNFDCLKECVASDGNVYQQPVNHTDETIKNVYAMVDFEQPLFRGVRLDGNVGVRGVFAEVLGTGLLTLTSIRKTAAFNPATPNAAGGIITQSFSQNVTFEGKTTDWLPTFNLNLWAFDDQIVLRGYGGKTVSRPTPSQLVPGGTCTIDERLVDDGDPLGCTGRVGNPNLKPFTAWSYNASLEWYPNIDTVLSVAYGKLDVKIGNPLAATRTARPFEGSTEIDPITGDPLSDLEFSYPTWENGPGYKRSIWEFTAKTAFTFLPWFLKYTGVDANLSILQSGASSGIRDPFTGDIMPPRDESKYYKNVSLWYDDGRLNMRVAYQDRSERFDCITPCGGNNVNFNYPGDGYSNVRMAGTGYNPGVPRFIGATTFIDAKISYNITDNIQVYAEGRNLTRKGQVDSAGDYNQFADGTPRVMRFSYAGQRLMGGVVVKFGAN